MGDEAVSMRVEYRTRTQYFHQADVFRNFLYVIDSSWRTHGDLILKFKINDYGKLDLVKKIKLKNVDKRMKHLNSIYFKNGSCYLMFHNNTSNGGIPSKIVKTDENFEVKETFDVNGKDAHNVFFDNDLCFVDSRNARLLWNGRFVGIDSGFRRGLAVDDEYILIGNTTIAKREHRKTSESSIDIYSRKRLEKLETIDLPRFGGISEIRFVDRCDYGLSAYSDRLAY